MIHDIDDLEKKKIIQFFPQANYSILEIGCGDGRVTEKISNNFSNYYALDPDKIKIAQAKSKLPNVKFIVGFGEKMPFPEDTFDFAIFPMSLHHQNATLSLREAYRVVKKNGIVIIIEPTKDSKIQQIYHLFDNELNQLNNSQYAIKTSPFYEMKREIFNISWQFENISELYTFNFSNGKAKNIKEKEMKILEIIGNRANDEPLVVLDELVAICLQKK